VKDDLSFFILQQDVVREHGETDNEFRARLIKLNSGLDAQGRPLKLKDRVTLVRGELVDHLAKKHGEAFLEGCYWVAEHDGRLCAWRGPSAPLYVECRDGVVLLDPQALAGYAELLARLELGEL
jgi:hypothetical protein